MNPILRGALKLCTLASVTYGPNGKTVVIDRGSPYPTKDGFLSIMEVGSRSRLETLGMNIVKSGVMSVSDSAGDGTTTTLILLGSMLKEAERFRAQGIQAPEIVQYLRDTTPLVLQWVRDQSIEASSENLMSLAMQASKGDADLSHAVLEALEGCGEGGCLRVVSGDGVGVEVEFKDGLEVPCRLGRQEFLRGETSRNLEGSFVVTTTRELKTFSDIAPLLEEINGNSVVIFGSVVGEALATAYTNDEKGVVTCVCLNPSEGSSSRHALEDIAAITGSKLWEPYEDFTRDHYGTLRSITIESKKALVVGYPDVASVETHVQRLNHLATVSSSDKDSETYRDRAAALRGGLVLVKVGGVTQYAAKERRGRAEDTIRTCEAALKHGVVQGGGVTLDSVNIQEDRLSCMWKCLKEPKKMLPAGNSPMDSTYALLKAIEVASSMASSLVSCGHAVLKPRGRNES